MNEHDDPIPQDFQSWRHCIEHWCGIELTPKFIDKRLAELEQPDHEPTRKFIQCYGQEHYERVKGWFREARESIK